MMLESQTVGGLTVCCVFTFTFHIAGSHSFYLSKPSLIMLEVQTVGGITLCCVHASTRYNIAASIVYQSYCTTVDEIEGSHSRRDKQVIYTSCKSLSEQALSRTNTMASVPS